MNPPLESGRPGARYSLFNFRPNIHPSIDKKHRSRTKDRDGQPPSQGGILQLSRAWVEIAALHRNFARAP